MLKYRISGALAIIALALIFVPLIFEKKGNSEPMSVPLLLPEKPLFSPLTLQPVAAPELVRERFLEPVPTADVNLKGWVVQAGSFAEKNNALTLQNRLRAQGFAAFVTEVEIAAGQWRFRVYVGPELLKENAEKQLKALKRQEGIDGSLLAYPHF
jgi:DedD protein